MHVRIQTYDCVHACVSIKSKQTLRGNPGQGENPGLGNRRSSSIRVGKTMSLLEV